MSFKHIYKRQVNHLCPNCMSKLKLVDGDYECTGDRLQIWQEEFKKFDMMNLKEKKGYLDDISDQDRFFKMYQSKDNLSCGYSTYRTPILPSYTENIADPLVVGRIERSLGRLLTEKELEEDFKFYRNENNFRLKPTYGYEEFKIPRILFPDEA